MTPTVLLRHRTSISLAMLLLAGACADGPQGGANRPPEVVLQLSAPAPTFSGGDSVDVALSATDPNEGALASSALSWWVTLHHASHTHPYRAPATGAAGRFGIGREGHEDHDVFLRVYARAVDEQGLADTVFVDLPPTLVLLTIASAPSALQVTLDGQPRTTPFTLPAIAGMERSVGAAPEQVLGSVVYSLSGWSDAGASTHTIVVPATSLTLTATYDSIATTNAAPSVTLTSPSAALVTGVGASVSLSVTAADPDGSIASVAYVANGSVVATSSTPPFNATWIPSTAGTYQLLARATDNGGAVGESPTRAVTVQPASAPTATLDLPADGTLGLTGAITLNASAADETSVSFVEFEVDGVWLATDSAAPYSAVVPSTAAYASGAHVVRARARDGDGNYSVWASARVTFGGSQALPAGFSRTTVTNALAATPTSIAVAPDGRIFVSEQTGALRVIKNGVLLAQPFAVLAVDANGEGGLLGIAFDPDFVANGWIYLYHTVAAGGTHNRISRFTALGDVAAAGSELVLVDLPPLGSSGRHRGGAMKFGPDGLLYVLVGDDGVSAHAPDLAVPFGKVLRFHKDGTIPANNPFYGVTTGLSRAIWARGLRNPFSFDIQLSTGRMHINDVGQSTWEEVNVGRAGANYGWPSTEGPTSAAGVDPPLLAYRHTNSPTLFQGYAVVGAAFYDPPTAMFGAEYVGDFFFADYVNQWIYRLDAQADWAPYAFATLDAPITGLAVGLDGALYVLAGNRVDRIFR